MKSSLFSLFSESRSIDPSLEPKRACVSCAYGQGSIAGPCGPMRICRRRAPAQYDNVHYPNGGTKFPVVGDQGWCGEWAPQAATSGASAQKNSERSLWMDCFLPLSMRGKERG